jgi:hypothetical protein
VQKGRDHENKEKMNLDLDVRWKLHYPTEFTPTIKVSKPKTDFRIRL